MFRRRMRRGVPPLNTTSTADISFMLLIFFLVTTSMGADKGIKRELPSIHPQEQQVASVREGDVMRVRIMADGQVMCGEQSVSPAQWVSTFKKFASQKPQQHVFQLSADREASYDTYYQVQSALQLAYRQLRDERARKEYGRAYAELTDAQRTSIDQAVPQRIAEQYDDQGKEAAQ